MKKAISILLCIVICISVTPVAALASGRNTSLEESLATDLKALGLFRGVSDTNFDLRRPPSRVEAIIMLIRVLGKENEALNGRFPHPFTDVDSWADNYVGYAYANNLSNGVSATQFGTGNANAAMYLTFVLRSLGYSDANGADFTWDNPFPLARTAGILPDLVNTSSFWRADVVLISYCALPAYLKNSTQTLAQKLIEAGVFSQVLFDMTYDPDAIGNYSPPENTELTAEEIYARCAPAVFYIDVYNSNGTRFAHGSGFFIESSGIAVTNYHVIEDAYSAKITLSDSGAVHDVTGVYDYNAHEDWAIIQVSGSGFSTLNIGASSTIVGAATVYALGSPLGLQNTISQGIISNPSRTEGGVHFVQTTAAISPGSSGGALINKFGEVIGITTAQYIDGQNLNLALPISYIEGHSRSNLVSLSTLFPGTGGSGDISNSVPLPVDGGEVRVNGRTVYEFRPSRSDYWVIQTSENGNHDPTLSLYDSSGREIAYNDDSRLSLNALILIYLHAGETYFIEAGFYATASGACTLSVVPFPQLPGSGGSVRVEDYTVYTFIPSQSGTWTFYTSSGTYDDPMISVCEDDFYIIAFDDDSGDNLDAIVSVYLEAGRTYIVELLFFCYDGDCTLFITR